jgi:hypothetical protein
MEVNGQPYVTAALLPRGKQNKTVWVSQPVWTFWRRENHLVPLSEIEPKYLGCPAPCLVTTPTELSQLISRMPHKTTLTGVFRDFPQPPHAIPGILLDIILCSLPSLSLPVVIHYFSYYLKLYSLNE